MATDVQRLDLPETTAEDVRQSTVTSNSSRLSLSFATRLNLSLGLSFLTGFGLGAVHGGTMAGLRFRAENAHRLPGNTAGWYLYHKSKNYQATYGGAKEGMKMGLKVGSLVAAYVVAEEALDAYREERDLLNSVIAGMGTAGLYSALNRFSIPTVARMGKVGFQFGFCLGLVQDVANSLRGHQPRYIKVITGAFR